MPNITDPFAVSFCNNMVRHKADIMVANYNEAKRGDAALQPIVEYACRQTFNLS